MDALLRFFRLLDAAPHSVHGVADVAAQALCDALGDFSLVAVLGSESSADTTCVSRHRRPDREDELSRTLGAGDPDRLGDLAAAVASGADVRRTMRRDGVRDTLLRAVLARDGEPLALLVCAREADSAAYDADDERTFDVLAEQLGLVLESVRAESDARGAADRQREAARRQMRLLRDVLVAGRHTRHRAAVTLHSDVLQRLVAATLRLDATPVRDDRTRALAEDLRAVSERLRDLLAELGHDREPFEDVDLTSRLAPLERRDEDVLQVRGQWGPVPWEVSEAVVRAIHDLVATVDPRQQELEVVLSEDAAQWRVDLPWATSWQPLSEASRVHLRALGAELRAPSGPGVELVLPRDPDRDPVARLDTVPPQRDHQTDPLGDVEDGAAAVVALASRLIRPPFSYAGLADIAVRLLGDAVGDYAALCLFPRPELGEPVSAVHHRLPDRHELFAATVGAATPDQALVEHVLRGEYGAVHGIGDVFWTAVRQEKRVVGFLLSGRDQDSPPYDEAARAWLTVAAEEIRLAVVLGEDRARAEALDRAMLRRTESRQALLPSLASSDELERRRIAEWVRAATGETLTVFGERVRVLADGNDDPLLRLVVQHVREADELLTGLCEELVPEEPTPTA